MNRSHRWDDLLLRVITGCALLALGGGAIWFGGATFAIVVSMAIGVVMWELASVVTGERSARALQIGVLACACLLLARQFESGYAVAILFVPAVAGAALLSGHRAVFGIYAIGIVVAGYGLAGFRDQQGTVLTLWLVAVVAATDIAGYFGGRLIGGRRFWPAVSPGKTWAGTVSGWFAAALVGLAFALSVSPGLHFVWISVLVGLASQIGDLAESAVKRRTGVKDSGSLLPGHGGFFDRFDGLLGAALFMALFQVFHQFPLSSEAPARIF